MLFSLNFQVKRIDLIKLHSTSHPALHPHHHHIKLCTHITLTSNPKPVTIPISTHLHTLISTPTFPPHSKHFYTHLYTQSYPFLTHVRTLIDITGEVCLAVRSQVSRYPCLLMVKMMPGLLVLKHPPVSSTPL